MSLPLVVDLDGTFLKIDTLFELFVRGVFAAPFKTMLALLELRQGIAPFKRRLCEVTELDVESLPVREDLLDYLNDQAAAGREMHLATAADQTIADAVAVRFPIFKTAQGTTPSENLKGPKKAARLTRQFPDGFVYAGDSRADLPVWKAAKAAVVVSASRSFCAAVQTGGTPIEREFFRQDSSPNSVAWNEVQDEFYNTIRISKFQSRDRDLVKVFI